MVTVNCENLRWAREFSKLSLKDASKKLGFTTSRKSTAVEKLEKLENGDKSPTQPQLEKMANVYRQPVVAFYLDSEPRKSDKGEDFRALPQQTLDVVSNAHLEILISSVKARQSLTRDLLEDEDAEPLAFVSSARTSMGIEHIANDIEKTLGFELERYRRRPSQPAEAFKYLRKCVQDLGIFVQLMSDLGHPQTNTIPVSVFRGFALADEIAPYIVINRKDDKRAQSFTALHEVAHIWLGSSGVTGTIDESSSSVERLCNRVAGRILLPPRELEELSSIRTEPFDNWLAKIMQFAEVRNISRAMVAYNLKLYNHIDQSTWQQLRHKYKRDQLARELEEREKRELDKALGKSTPIDPNRVKRFSLGEPLLDLARRSVANGGLTPTKASTLLGVNPRKVRSFLYPHRWQKGI